MRLSLLKCIPLATFIIMGVTNISWTSNHANVDAGNSVKKMGMLLLHSNNISTKANSLALLYDSLELEDKGLSQDAFDQAMAGYEKLELGGELRNDSIITIIDFDQPSYKKRLYVIDIANQKIIFNTWAAHGMNTGREVAQSFSNSRDSHKSSLGFYITSDTYYGSKGFSLKLIGLEQNVNSNAYNRAIVMHGAPYVSQSFIDAQGYIGRSHGCPAVAPELNRPIIEKIKEGSLLFIYNKSYKPSKKFQLG